MCLINTYRPEMLTLPKADVEQAMLLLQDAKEYVEDVIAERCLRFLPPTTRKNTLTLEALEKDKERFSAAISLLKSLLEP